MTAVNFPDNPSVGQVFTVGERTWKWTGTTWDVVVTTQITGPQGPKGDVGEGVPAGGTVNQVLSKSSDGDYDTVWATPAPLSYIHSQATLSNTWTITHNLGFYPNVTVKDNFDNIVEGYITYNNTSTLTIQFSYALSGIAYLS
jgi:hypothetical protein